MPPDFGSDAIDDALDDDLPEVDTNGADPREIDAALDGPDTADTDDAPDNTGDAEAETDTSDAPDDDALAVEATDEVGDPDTPPGVRQRRRTPRRQRRAARVSETDGHNTAATTADELTDDTADTDDAPDTGDAEAETDTSDAPDDDALAARRRLTDDTDDTDPAEPANTDDDDTDATRGTSTVTASTDVWGEPPDGKRELRDGKPTTEAVAVSSLWLPLGALAFVLSGAGVAVRVAVGWMLLSLPLLISTGGREPEVAA